jgi:hypothetical protein
MKLSKARFVGADGKLSLTRGIPIPLPDHVVLIKPTSALLLQLYLNVHLRMFSLVPMLLQLILIVVHLLVLGLLLHVSLRVLLRLILLIYSMNSNLKRLSTCRSMHLSPQVRLKTYLCFGMILLLVLGFFSISQGARTGGIPFS